MAEFIQISVALNYMRSRFIKILSNIAKNIIKITIITASNINNFRTVSNIIQKYIAHGVARNIK